MGCVRTRPGDRSNNLSSARRTADVRCFPPPADASTPVPPPFEGWPDSARGCGGPGAGAGGVAVYVRQQSDAPAAGAACRRAPQPTVDEVITKLEARLQTNPQDAEAGGCSAGPISRPAVCRGGHRDEGATTLDPRTRVFLMLGEALVMASKDGGGLPPDAKAASIPR